MPQPVDFSDLMTPASGGDVDLSDLIQKAKPSVEAVARFPTAREVLAQPKTPPIPGGRFGAATRAAAREIIPTGAAAMGAASGAEAGAFGGPFAPFTVPVGALVGGGLGYWLGKRGQQSVLDNWVPQGALKSIGQDPAQVRADQQAYPLTTGLAGMAPSVLTGGALTRGLIGNPALADMAAGQAFAKPAAAAGVTSTINATRAAADRQGVPLPTTLTSPTGYRVSRLLPNVFGSGAINTAEAAAPQAVGARLTTMAEKYGMPTELGAAGAKVQDAAARWAERQRVTGGDLLEQANQQGTGIRIPPTQTMGYLDKTIAELSTNPLTNAAAIRMLGTLKGDLANPDNPLDLASLRNLRSAIYNASAPEGLTPSFKAKIAGDLWTNLSADINSGLSGAAKEGDAKAAGALDAFNKGNAVWSDRQKTLQGTLGKILGTDVSEDLSDPIEVTYVSSKPPEDAAAAINKLVGSDRRGVRTLMGTLDPDAQDTVRASVIASLGRDPSGGFNANTFLSQMHSIPVETREALFGKGVTASLNDLETIVRNMGKAEPRAHGFGSLATEMAIPAALGFAHSGAGGASEGVLAVAAANAAAAHFLSKPDTLKWVAKLAAASQKGGNAVAPVVDRLTKAATTSPALAALASTVQTAMANAQATKPAKPKDAPPAFDPSRMTDEELNAQLPSPPAPEVTPATTEHVALDPAAYPNKPLEDLIPRVAQAESADNPHAVSPKGAEGLFQAMPATQTDPGFGVKPVQDSSLEEKSRVGEDYLNAMIARYGGQQVLALMAHNMGPGRVDRWVKAGMKDPVPKETRDYVHKILGEN